jgi:hypothetical protein
MVDNNAGRVHPEMPPTKAEIAAHTAGSKPEAQPEISPLAAQATQGRFNKHEGSAAISSDHDVTWNTKAGGAFAELYTAHQHVAGGRFTQPDLKRDEQFRAMFAETSRKSGFGGSGTSTYVHRTTGDRFVVEAMANGKSFWGTTHVVTQLATSGVSSRPWPGQKPTTVRVTSGKYVGRTGQQVGNASARGKSGPGTSRVVVIPGNQGLRGALIPKTSLEAG